MEIAVKATGYAAIFTTNSADVKNIAHDEQSDCLFQGTFPVGKPANSC